MSSPSGARSDGAAPRRRPPFRGRLDAAARWLERRATAPDGTVDRRVVAATLAGSYLVFIPTYLAVNFYSVGRPAHVLWLPGEAELVPFVPEAEFVYVLGYLLPLVALVRIPDARSLVRLVAAFLTTLIVACVTYLLFPVYLQRPELEVTSPATWLLSLEYTDPSYNHFPSLHIGTAVLLYLACRKGMRRPGLLAGLIVAIGISTLLVRQHYLVDLVYGAGLAAAAWAAAGRWLPERRGPRTAPPGPDDGRGRT